MALAANDKEKYDIAKQLYDAYNLINEFPHSIYNVDKDLHIHDGKYFKLTSDDLFNGNNFVDEDQLIINANAAFTAKHTTPGTIAKITDFCKFKKCDFTADPIEETDDFDNIDNFAKYNDTFYKNLTGDFLYRQIQIIRKYYKLTGEHQDYLNIATITQDDVLADDNSLFKESNSFYKAPAAPAPGPAPAPAPAPGLQMYNKQEAGKMFKDCLEIDGGGVGGPEIDDHEKLQKEITKHFGKIIGNLAKTPYRFENTILEQNLFEEKNLLFLPKKFSPPKKLQRLHYQANGDVIESKNIEEQMKDLDYILGIFGLKTNGDILPDVVLDTFMHKFLIHEKGTSTAKTLETNEYFKENNNLIISTRANQEGTPRRIFIGLDTKSTFQNQLMELLNVILKYNMKNNIYKPFESPDTKNALDEIKDFMKNLTDSDNRRSEDGTFNLDYPFRDAAQIENINLDYTIRWIKEFKFQGTTELLNKIIQKLKSLEGKSSYDNTKNKILEIINRIVADGLIPYENLDLLRNIYLETTDDDPFNGHLIKYEIAGITGSVKFTKKAAGIRDFLKYNHKTGADGGAGAITKIEYREDTITYFKAVISTAKDDNKIQCIKFIDKFLDLNEDQKKNIIKTILTKFYCYDSTSTNISHTYNLLKNKTSKGAEEKKVFKMINIIETYKDYLQNIGYEFEINDDDNINKKNIMVYLFIHCIIKGSNAYNNDVKNNTTTLINAVNATDDGQIKTALEALNKNLVGKVLTEVIDNKYLNILKTILEKADREKFNTQIANISVGGGDIIDAGDADNDYGENNDKQIRYYYLKRYIFRYIFKVIPEYYSLWNETAANNVDLYTNYLIKKDHNTSNDIIPTFAHLISYSKSVSNADKQGLIEKLKKRVNDPTLNRKQFGKISGVLLAVALSAVDPDNVDMNIYLENIIEIIIKKGKDLGFDINEPTEIYNEVGNDSIIGRILIPNNGGYNSALDNSVYNGSLMGEEFIDSIKMIGTNMIQANVFMTDNKVVDYEKVRKILFNSRSMISSNVDVNATETHLDDFIKIFGDPRYKGDIYPKQLVELINKKRPTGGGIRKSKKINYKKMYLHEKRNYLN